MVGASSGRLDHYRTSRFQSWSGVKVNIGKQREFRLVSGPENRSRWCHLSADVFRGNNYYLELLVASR